MYDKKIIAYSNPRVIYSEMLMDQTWNLGSPYALEIRSIDFVDPFLIAIPEEGLSELLGIIQSRSGIWVRGTMVYEEQGNISDGQSWEEYGSYCNSPTIEKYMARVSIEADKKVCNPQMLMWKLERLNRGERRELNPVYALQSERLARAVTMQELGAIDNEQLSKIEKSVIGIQEEIIKKQPVFRWVPVE